MDTVDCGRKENVYTDINDRRNTILSTLDSVHRSLLINNLQYDEANQTSRTSEMSSRKKQLRRSSKRRSVSSEKSNDLPISHTDHYGSTGDAVDTDSVDNDEMKSYPMTKKKINRKSLDQQSVEQTKNANKNVQIKVNLIRAKSVDERKLFHHHRHIEFRRSPKETTRMQFGSSKNSAPLRRTSIDRSTTNSSHEGSIYFDCLEFQKTPSPPKNSANIRRSLTNPRDIDRPMIHIVQEMTCERVVTSTVCINREKAKQFSGGSSGHQCTIVRSKPVKRRKCRQKVDRENVQNEILAQTNDWNQFSVDDGEHDSSATSSSRQTGASSMALGTVPTVHTTVPPFRLGRLEAHNSKHSNIRPVGRLMTKRLEREQVTLKRQQMFNGDLQRDDENGNRKPPSKPPRTFASSSKSSSDAGNSSTTVAIEDITSSARIIKSQTSIDAPATRTPFQKLGWTFNVPIDIPPATVRPSCPTLDEVSEIGYEHKKFGWIEPHANRQSNDIYNMLNYEHKVSEMTSFNLTPQPQTRLSIDTVDCTPKRRSGTFEQFAANSIFSTPINRTLQEPCRIVPDEQPIDVDRSSRETNDSDQDYCKKCRLKVVTPKEYKGTFKKNAIRRTKSFFRASKRKISSSKRMLNPKNGLTDTEDCPPSPAKSTTTEQLNKSLHESAKKTVKYLGLTPLKLEVSDDENTIDSPARKSELLQTSVRGPTPPEKPLRKSRLIVSNAAIPVAQKPSQESFDFDRKIQSPKQGDDQSKRRFMLSPKKLFKTLQPKSSPSKQANGSYRSFVEQDDDFVIFMGEYLKHMMRKIDQPENDLSPKSDHPSAEDEPRRVSSISSDGLDKTPQRLVEEDIPQPEPIYAEIVNKPNDSLMHTPLKHIIANNNPKAIYTTVNKTPRGASQLDDNQFELKSLSSEESQITFRLGNALSVSIENILSKIQCDDTSSIHSMPRIEHSVLLHRAPPSDDDISESTNLTENICDDVQCGETINSDIANVIERLERLDPALECREFRKATQESDDGSVIYLSDGDERTGEDQADGIQVTSNENSERDRDLPIDTVDFSPKITVDEATRSFSDTLDTTLKPTNRPFKSPNLKNFTLKLRNSFNRSTNYFRGKEDQPSIGLAEGSVSLKRMHTREMYDQLNVYLLKLNSQIVYQCEIRAQLKKAIGLCRSSRELDSSAELVEAERLQLLAHRKELCARQQIDRITSGDTIEFIAAPERCRATISITDLEIPLKAEALYDTYFNYFYVCICSYRDQCVATVSRERQGNRVRFENLQNIVFTRLDPQFQIFVEVYVMRLHKGSNSMSITGDGNRLTPGKEEKRSPLLLTPVRAIANLASPKIDTNKSKFRFQGNCAVQLDCLQSSEYVENRRSKAYGENPFVVFYSSMVRQLMCQGVPGDRSNVNGPISVGFDSEIVLLNNPTIKSFLNVADAKHQCWKRQWSAVDGCCVHFWNEKEDQQNLAPCLSIDLTKCCNDTIQLVDRKICAMPMVFEIDICPDRGGQNSTQQEHQANEPKKIFIAADCNTDLINWLSELNRILEFIRDWRI